MVRTSEERNEQAGQGGAPAQDGGEGFGLQQRDLLAERR